MSPTGEPSAATDRPESVTRRQCSRPGEVHPDRGGGRDRPLEGRRGLGGRTWRAGCPAGAGPALPGLLLAAHHQLAVPRGGPPVDPPQVVALAVLPWRDVVLARRGHRTRPRLAAARPLAAERGRAAGARPAGSPSERVGGERAGQLDQAERVGQPYRQRADRVAAAHVGADPVADLRCPRGSTRSSTNRAAAPSGKGPGPPPAAGRSAAGRRSPGAARRAPHGRPAPGRVEAARAGEPVAGPADETRPAGAGRAAAPRPGAGRARRG